MASTSPRPGFMANRAGERRAAPKVPPFRDPAPAPSSAAHHHQATAQLGQWPTTATPGVVHNQHHTAGAHTHGVAATTRHRTTQPLAHPAAVTPPLSVGRWRQAVGGTAGTAWQRPGTATKPSQPPGTRHPGTLPPWAPAHPPGTRQLHHSSPILNSRATVTPLNFAIRSGFWSAAVPPPHAAASLLPPEHLKPAGTALERAKTQVSVHKRRRVRG